MHKFIAVIHTAFAMAGVAHGQSTAQVGMTGAFPAAMHSGAPVEFQIWEWGADKKSARKELALLREGQRVPVQSLTRTGVQYLFRIGAPHDSVECWALSSDGFGPAHWGPEKVDGRSHPAQWYHVFAEQYPAFPQVGRYSLTVKATNGGKTVAKSVIRFEIVAAGPAPRNTQYLRGKRDIKGNLITWSKPVALGALNETPVLRDNDYPFEPQRAYNVVNWERFPPFHLPQRFIAVWNSRRFTDEDKFGGPLNRGFTALATIKSEQDNLPIKNRVWFHTPDAQVAIINQWYREDPAKYADLKAYADYRSAFVSADNAYKLGWTAYGSWGAGGYGGYDPGLYGWDEEQMWPTIAAKLLQEHPELVPERLRHWKDKDPKVEGSGTLAVLQDAYISAWGDFIGNGYRGARANAAQRGRTIKIWHYGSKAPGDFLFLGGEGAKIDPATGKYRADEPDALWPWFKTGNKVDFHASEYARQIDYFNKDFYYQTIFPQTSSLYEKDAGGKYVLDDKGRRKIRHDVFDETMYIDPVKIGHEDTDVSPVFLKAFLAKGENALFWLNGGKYPKQHGTAITDKQLIPTLRPGNQETWGEAAHFGSRPISPYMAEAAAIYTYMMGLEGLYLWDARLFTGPAGFGPNGDNKQRDTLGDLEFIVKGMHRISQFDSLFEGRYSYVRPVRFYDTWNRDHPLIRGILNGRYLALAMTNPYLDPGETQVVEAWYDAPGAKAAKPLWAGRVRLQARRTHLFQCKLPPLPMGQKYDPDNLRFRYTCADGTFRKTFIATGNYEVPYTGH